MTPTTNWLTRRRTLQLLAASAAFVGVGAGAAARRGDLFRWRGVALGADAEMALLCADECEANRLFDIATNEIGRLESVFSLYRPDSALSRLNEALELVHPPAELLEVLSIADSAHRATGGAFDPAVQSLWKYHAEVATGAASADPARLEKLVAESGWGEVSWSADRIALSSPAAALTLNGIAQGYITDRVAALLRAQGMTNILIDLGEIVASGRKSPLSRWRIGLAGAASDAEESIALENSAIATSAPLATTFDQAGRLSHIIDPGTGRPAQSPWRRISVIDKSAAFADAMSTGFTLMAAGEIARTLRQYPSMRLHARASDGALIRL